MNASAHLHWFCGSTYDFDLFRCTVIQGCYVTAVFVFLCNWDRTYLLDGRGSRGWFRTGWLAEIQNHWATSEALCSHWLAAGQRGDRTHGQHSAWLCWDRLAPLSKDVETEELQIGQWKKIWNKTKECNYVDHGCCLMISINTLFQGLGKKLGIWRLAKSWERKHRRWCRRTKGVAHPTFGF